MFYDQKGLASAARGWWMMGLFGHDRAAVLDGGLPKWLAEGRPAESGDARRAGRRRPSARISAPTRLRGIGDMLANVAQAARTGAGRPRRRPLHRRGAGAARRHALRPYPGRANLPYTELLAPDQTLLPPDALRARFGAGRAWTAAGRW